MLLTPTLLLFGLGLLSAVLLAVASKVFYVWEDPKILEVEDSLLGANCGGCGFAGCSSAAAAVVAGKAGASVCVAGGTEVAMKVAALLGAEVEIKEPEVAYSSCSYSVANAETKYTYTGMNDCRAAVLFDGGPKKCPIGCVGFGSCVKACPFGAISMGNHGLPVFDRNRCRACGVCVETCPKNIIYLTSTSNRMISDYKTDECTTPCQRTCPTGIDIPAYIKQITLGNYKEAVRIIKEKNPLPAIVGRICPAPCEAECRRTLQDEPVAINNLKRFVADYEMKYSKRVYPYIAPDSGKKVAVIGGGAEGLTASFYLACLGHKATIYEAMPKLGGIIRNVIPKSRLPEKVIDWDIKGVLDLGVQAKTKTILGKDVTISSLLKDGFDAILLSSGGVDSKKVLRGNKETEQAIPGIYTLLDFLISSKNGKNPEIGKSVAIIGCGNSTIDAAMVCKKNGASSVTIIHPYSREELITRNIDIAKYESEGITFSLLSNICKISGDGNKLISAIVKNIDGSQERELPVDTVIVSAGRVSDLIIVPVTDKESGNRIGEKWDTLPAHKLFRNNNSDDIFNLGENAVINDNIAVVKAIGRGRRLSRAVHLHLKGKEVEPQEKRLNSDYNVLNINKIENVEKLNRQIMPKSSEGLIAVGTDNLYNEVEMETGLTEKLAKKEADRCLQCGLICYKHEKIS